MATHCNPNDKPNIYYKFKGESAYRKIQIGVAPIEIIIEAVSDFRETIIIFRKPEDSFFTIPRDSTRKKLVLKPLPWRYPNDQDIYGSAASYNNDEQSFFAVKNYYQINNVDYTTKIGEDVIIEGLKAQDKYFLDVSSFSNKYDFTFTYQEYF